jgi:hypothetical protein
MRQSRGASYASRAAELFEKQPAEDNESERAVEPCLEASLIHLAIAL